MSTATKSSPLPLELHDAPRATPPAHPESAVHEVAREPAVLDDLLDDRYDNVACTD